MNRDEIRLNNVRALIREIGGIAKFAELVGMSSSQVSQFAGRNPTRGIENAVAERIGHAFTKPTGWLDRLPHELKTTSKVKGEPVRSIIPQARTMFELFASLPENTQDELFRAVEGKKEDYEVLNSVQNFPDLGWKQRPKVSTLAM